MPLRTLEHADQVVRVHIATGGAVGFNGRLVVAELCKEGEAPPLPPAFIAAEQVAHEEGE